jgi:branched-chain amino acid transport system substrate-binding protein
VGLRLAALGAGSGGGPRRRRLRWPAGRRRAGFQVLVALVLAASVAACSSGGSSSSTSTSSTPGSTPGGSTGGSSAPGVTSSSITFGQVDDLTSPLPGLFKGAEDGTRAYFDYVNSLGGVYGRKLILDARDSAFQAGQVSSDTGDQIRKDFALVGGFSLLDGSEKILIDLVHMPDIAYPLDPTLANDPNVFSPSPNTNDDFPLGIFKYLKSKFPTAIKHVGILYTTATSSTVAAEAAFERALTSQGFVISYKRGFGPLETTFLSDVLAMKSNGVQMFFSQQLPDTYAATVAKEMQEQNFHPINVEGDAYSNQLIPSAGSAANGMYIDQAYPLYLGEDAGVVPVVSLFDKWMKKASPQPNFEIESIFGWASAQLMVEALRAAGPNPTRAGLVSQLDKITSFNAGGLLPNTNPAQNIPPDCFLLAQVQNGKFVRVPPSPKSGFYCGAPGYLAAAGFHPEVRPAPSS